MDGFDLNSPHVHAHTHTQDQNVNIYIMLTGLKRFKRSTITSLSVTPVNHWPDSNFLAENV